MANLLNMVKKTTKNWWVSLLVGLLSILLGFWCINTPIAAFMAIVWLFVATLFVAGVLEVVFAVSNRNILYGWGWNLTGGILDVVLSIFLMSLPPNTQVEILLYLVGFWIVFRSIWTIGVSMELQQYGVKGWGWLLALAILSLLFSILFFVSPLLSGMFLIFFISLALISYGAFRIWLSFEIKSLNKKIKELEKEI